MFLNLIQIIIRILKLCPCLFTSVLMNCEGVCSTSLGVYTPCSSFPAVGVHRVTSNDPLISPSIAAI